MIQQMWRPFRRLVRCMALRCWVRQLPHDADLKPALSASVPRAATPEAERALGRGDA
jgi:hypothetical protein